ncbi:nucleoside-diphosphate-sugar pyrophosphorylase [Candidatus Woesearchaeota archaeon]|nr:nucleoside-diphosphate-sugar pyrophosphorylase [Candidatus Woesearchaeota archaeon]|tara:strand:+ start:9631 stop:10368 length:738 start_codon:yes stop_codon:yes gene_type:complete
MKAVITCAGYASRLWPLTKDTPKPLLEVKGRPIIEHIIDKITEISEVDGIYVVTNEKFSNNFENWLQGKSFKVPIKILNDSTTSNDDRLGQVGDIQFVIEKENVNDDFLIVAGDNLFNFSLMPSFEAFKNNTNIVNPLWESKSFKAARESGSVVLNEDDNSFSEFMEKAPNPKSTLLSLGIYFFPKQKLELIKRYIDEKNNADKMGYFLTWLMQQEKVFGHVYLEKWFDIGWIEALEEARQKFGT